MEFSKKLKLLAARHRYSQAMLAHRVGVSQNLVSLWMRGQNVPDMYEAAQLASLFRVDMSYLADDKLDEPPDEARVDTERAILKVVRALNIDEDEALRRLATPAATGSPWLPGAVRTFPDNPGPRRSDPPYPDAVQGRVHRTDDAPEGESSQPKPKRKRG